ncbi:Retinoblastoma-associated protein A domain [Nesidiocoris tenuis]|uniref:Retinoblastoma-associated protein A domain n=1 Tax=Nesidiocoris tenuis TaxID=355587 RepID=A0ABN7BA67_9HEMI|nr:Retinoblastoma-associated protein A domain [Nesidiocoris tenuis]
MGLSDDVERRLMKNLNEICRAFNLDKSSAADAWKHLVQLSDSYVLEGDPLQWLGCTLYFACKSSFTPAPKTTIVAQTNLVSLTGLLRHIDLSLIDFFVKMQKCSSLLSLPDDFREHMDKLEKNFNVSMVLFRKFQPIFIDIFNTENSDAPKSGGGASKSKKSKPQPLNYWRIMDFTWTLFICVKANINNITDDLVNSYHLLLACIDYVHANVSVAGRKELLRGNYSSVPTKTKYADLSELPCIIDYLCSTHDGIAVDVKSVKEYCLRKYLKKLFDIKILRGNSLLLTDVLDASLFDMNLKALEKVYEEYTLGVGGVDERVFLGYSSNTSCNIGNFDAYNRSNVLEIKLQLEARRKQNGQQGKTGTLLTPLSGKRYLKHQDSLPARSSHGASIHATLMTRDPGPTKAVIDIIQMCSKPPIVLQTIESLTQKLHSGLLEGADTDDKNIMKEIRNVTDLSSKLFFKFLDSLLPEEVKKPTFDPNTMMNNEDLIKALFSCAAEVVLYTSKLSKPFPWVINTLAIPSYYCYKVIEVIVTYEDILTRELVKHLNAIEESILESYAWSKESPLWKALAESTSPIPTCEDVVQEGAVEVTEVTRNGATSGDKLAELASRSSVLMNSPGAPLVDKFMSPVKSKRPLSAETADQPPEKKTAVAKDGAQVAVIAEPNDQASNDTRPDAQRAIARGIKKPKRTGSINLFFRKFYYLAVVRMLDMCNQLELSDIELRRKIWTCFESSIVNHVGLMWNRHLDQLLMCSIYVVCKIVDRDPSFKEMMKCYRNQPQAQSQVYRQVLISPDKSFDEIKAELNKKPADVNEERGDIIRFYNEVFIRKVKELTRKFRPSSDQSDRIVLSPILVGKSTPNSGPRRVSEKHPLFLRALLPRSPINGTQLQYHFSRSPAKDLHAINNMVCKAESRKPKILKDSDSDVAKEHLSSISQKVKDIYADRISLNRQDPEKRK